MTRGAVAGHYHRVLPAVLVLSMGTALAHMLRADAGTAADAQDNRTGGAAVSRFPAWSAEDQAEASNYSRVSGPSGEPPSVR
jgi:hypothetical protein